MKIIRSIRTIKNELGRKRRQGKTIGFVPTMGFLHEGHLSLIRQAKKDADVVVVSIFVNPTQFGPKEDYRRYPRGLKKDAVLCKKEGADYIFAPTVESIYPPGFSTYVLVENLTEDLCGKFRPRHFRGVTTVVTKLLNTIKPDIAYFGQKDAQQAIVIKRMVKDLDMDIKIKVLPVVREKDGLAISSRNVYLSSDERKRAATIYHALQEAKNLVKLDEKDSNAVISRIRRILSGAVTKVDYISVVDPDTLKDIKTIKEKALVALAVWIGNTRLIDNIIVRR